MAGLDTLKAILLWVCTALVVACVIVLVVTWIMAKNVNNTAKDLNERLIAVQQKKSESAPQE